MAEVKGYLVRNARKTDIIKEIEREDAKQGHFYPDGQYRYGIKHYYGDLNKYDKTKLVKIWQELIKNR